MNTNRYYSSDRPLTDDDIRRYAPSVFAAEPYTEMTSRYQFISTIQVVEAMRNEGFVPVRAQQSRSNIEGKRDYARHIIAFNVPDTLAIRHVGDVSPQIILMNSHDGSSTYQLMAALWRKVCANGLIVADSTLASVRVKHSGRDVVSGVVEGTHELVKALPMVTGHILEWQGTELIIEEQIAYADAAIGLRYDKEKQHVPITPAQLIQPRRTADVRDDLFTVYNRVQEGLVAGGLNGRDKSNKERKTRALSSITENVTINKALWELTQAMAEIKRSQMEVYA